MSDVRLYLRTQACMYVCMYACMHTCMHVRMYVWSFQVMLHFQLYDLSFRRRPVLRSETTCSQQSTAALPDRLNSLDLRVSFNGKV